MPDLAADITVTGGDSEAHRLAFAGLGQAAYRRARLVGRGSARTGRLKGRCTQSGGVSRTHLRLRQLIDLSRLSGIGRFSDAQDLVRAVRRSELDGRARRNPDGGPRYQQDRQKRNGTLGSAAQTIPLDFDRTFHAWLPKLSLAYDFSPDVRAGILVERAYNPGGTTLAVRHRAAG